MASAKLTTTVRDQIVARLLRHRFSGEAAQLIADRSAFALRVYDNVFSKSQRDLMASLPKGWLAEGCDLHVSFGSSRSYVGLKFNGRDYGDIETMLDVKPNPIWKPFPASQLNGCVKVFEPTDPLAHENDALSDRLVTLKESINEARSSIRAVVNSVTTTGKLREVWPEIGTFLEDFEETKLSLPAVPTRELNALLDLPVEATS